MKFKILTAALLATLVIQSFAQTHKNKPSKGFIINGRVPAFKDSVMLGWFAGYKFDLQIVPVVNGNFVFTGNIPRPTCALLGATDGSFSRLVYFENGEITITQEKIGDKMVVSGSAINDDFEEFSLIREPITKKFLALYDEVEKLKLYDPVAAEKKKLKELDPAEEENRNLAKKYILTHPNKIFSLMQLIVMRLQPGELKSLFYSLDSVIRERPESMYIKKKIARDTSVYVGRPVIDFIQKSDKGIEVDSRSYRGKYLLIDFWASWCGPCRMENPRVLKAYERFKDRGFDIIGISLDDKVKDWEKAIAEDMLPWIQVSDLNGMNNAAGNLYNIISVPSNFLIDPKGIIIAQNLRGDELEKKLDEIFSVNKAI